MEPPVVTCPSPFTVRIPSTHTSAVVDYENLVSASDNVAEGVAINISPSDIYPFTVGVYNPVATATDSSGNVHQCTFQMTVSGEVQIFIFLRKCCMSCFHLLYKRPL